MVKWKEHHFGFELGKRNVRVATSKQIPFRFITYLDAIERFTAVIGTLIQGAPSGLASSGDSLVACS